MKSIIVQHMGNIGNRLFQYMFARHLQSKVSGSKVIGYHVPGWDLENNESFTNDTGTLMIEGNHDFNVGRIAYLLNHGIFDSVRLRVFAQKMEYLPEVEQARSLLLRQETGHTRIADSEMLINIRGAEILSGLHKDYGPVKIDFYRNIISDTGLKPVFMGQIDDGVYGSALRSSFPDARFLAHSSPTRDFETIYNAKNIVCSVSSFSWLAAWLSPIATHIHLPVSGFMNPAQRPDIDLLPNQDQRFSYYKFPILKWEGSPEQVADAIGGRHDFQKLDDKDIISLKRAPFVRR